MGQPQNTEVEIKPIVSLSIFSLALFCVNGEWTRNEQSEENNGVENQDV